LAELASIYRDYNTRPFWDSRGDSDVMGYHE